MPPLSSDQVNQLRAQGYTQNEIQQIIGAPDAATALQLADHFEYDRIFHAGVTGFNANQVAWIRAVSEPAGKWQAMQTFQNQNLWNYKAAGFTDPQIQWLAALPDDASRWQWMSKFQQQNAAESSGLPPAVNLPGFPSLPPGSSDASAKAIITGFLENYGLGGLADWAWTQFQNGAPIEQIMLDLRKRPEYKARFPAMEALAKKGMAISEAQYVDYERQATGVMRAAGLPEGFYDQHSDFTRFLTNEVSISELNDRVQLAAQAAFQAPAEVKSELQRLYGIGPGDLTAYWIDPDKALPLLQQRFVSAQIGGASMRTGFGQLAVSEAERLASLGIENPTEGFSTLVANRELFGVLPGEPGQAIGRGDQLAAAFEGNAEAQAKIEKRARTRLAPFSAGGGYALSREGFGGLGEQNRG